VHEKIGTYLRGYVKIGAGQTAPIGIAGSQTRREQENTRKGLWLYAIDTAQVVNHNVSLAIAEAGATGYHALNGLFPLLLRLAGGLNRSEGVTAGAAFLAQFPRRARRSAARQETE